ncbi:MAG: hypothetical protein CMO81_01955 [Waddliaceae bacterium]|nr:hypothetical protein [Waddliaceae bacterium]
MLNFPDHNHPSFTFDPMTDEETEINQLMEDANRWDPKTDNIYSDLYNRVNTIREGLLHKKNALGIKNLSAIQKPSPRRFGGFSRIKKVCTETYHWIRGTESQQSTYERQVSILRTLTERLLKAAKTIKEKESHQLTIEPNLPIESEPVLDESPSIGTRGIKNPGNTCWFASVAQILHWLPELREKFPAPTENEEVTAITVLRDLCLNELSANGAPIEDVGKYIDLIATLSKNGEFASRNPITHIHEQQDATRFLQIVLNNVLEAPIAQPSMRKSLELFEGSRVRKCNSKYIQNPQDYRTLDELREGVIEPNHLSLGTPPIVPEILYNSLNLSLDRISSKELLYQYLEDLKSRIENGKPGKDIQELCLEIVRDASQKGLHFSTCKNTSLDELLANELKDEPLQDTHKYRNDDGTVYSGKMIAKTTLMPETLPNLLEVEIKQLSPYMKNAFDIPAQWQPIENGPRYQLAAAIIHSGRHYWTVLAKEDGTYLQANDASVTQHEFDDEIIQNSLELASHLFYRRID